MDRIMMKMLSSAVLAKVNELQDALRKRNRVPSRPLFRIVASYFPLYSMDVIWEVIASLEERGFVKTGLTINDHWVEAVRNGGE